MSRRTEIGEGAFGDLLPPLRDDIVPSPRRDMKMGLDTLGRVLGAVNDVVIALGRRVDRADDYTS